MFIYNFYKTITNHFKYTRILNKVYESEHLLNNLSELFGAKVKKDKIGRLYVVINPNIKNGKFETNDQIFEYNDVGLDNSTYVEKWIMQRLNVAKSFIQANNLFDLLTYEIKKIDDYDNFLFIMMPITLPDVLKYMKKIFISLGVMTIISLILVLTI